MQTAISVYGRMVDSTTIELDEPVPLRGRVRVIISSVDDMERPETRSGLTSAEARRLSIEPNKWNGKPTITSCGLSAHYMVELVANGCGVDDIVVAFPEVNVDDIAACISWAVNAGIDLKGLRWPPGFLRGIVYKRRLRALARVDYPDETKVYLHSPDLDDVVAGKAADEDKK